MKTTALDILKKNLFDHYRPSFSSDERANEVVELSLVFETTEPILAAMREIYELGFKDGGHLSAFNGYPGQTDAPSLEERVKQLFPDKMNLSVIPDSSIPDRSGPDHITGHYSD